MKNQMHPDLLRINNGLRDRLTDIMSKPDDFCTGIEGLCLHRKDLPEKAENCVNKPFVSVIAQGGKRSVVGNEEYRYGEHNCMVCGVDMPSIHYVEKISPDHPFLSVSLGLDKQIISQLAMDIALPKSTAESHSAISIRPVDVKILDAFVRLTDLLDAPDQIPVLAPLVIREIHYRLLIGPQGESLRMLNTLGSQSNYVAQAISWLKSHYKETFQVNDLADMSHMSVSNFHRHFRKVTSLTPLQYQKRLRLHEAQRLMLTEDIDATRACMEVGYESSTQFSREYKRLFGEPPLKSIVKMKTMPNQAPNASPS